VWSGGAALSDCLTSTLNTFFSKSTYTIFDTKICLESAWHWLSILLTAFFFKLPFSCH
jgi:hypothetical protein